MPGSSTATYEAGQRPLTPDGRAKLADFGLVRPLDDLTRRGRTFAAHPCSCRPSCSRNPASPQSDIYALGGLLFSTRSPDAYRFIGG